jgi:ADP-heptose:LPS heptosyltransferase
VKKNTRNQKNTVDIILQPRLGDAILSLPAILCIQQLNKNYKADLDVKIVSNFSGLAEVLQAFDIGESIEMSPFQKIKTWVCRSQKAFFLAPTTKNWGYKAKETYGLFNPFRKHVKYDNEINYISFQMINQLFPSVLINFLKENYGFSTVTTSIFGVCLDLGFSADQIIDTFKFNTDIFTVKKELTDWMPPLKENNYVVFCMEAASSRVVDADRRWDEGNYLKIAEKLYNEYGFESAFIGLDDKFLIPDSPYIVDFRKKLSMVKLAQLLRFSKGYIGNDTGPLHLCNLMQKPSIGVYFREPSTTDFTPVFPHLNKIILKPANIEEVYSQVGFLLR